MEHIREYLISVTAAAILTGIVRSIAGEKGSTGEIVRLICGIFLVITVVRPVADIQLRNISLYYEDLTEEAQSAVEEGQDYAQRAMARLIKDQAEAYILDKAQMFHAQVDVEVYVSDDITPVPIACRVTGNMSPYAKKKLMEIIESDLGIRKEAQQWNP